MWYLEQYVRMGLRRSLNNSKGNEGGLRWYS